MLVSFQELADIRLRAQFTNESRNGAEPCKISKNIQCFHSKLAVPLHNFKKASKCMTAYFFVGFLFD